MDNDALKKEIYTRRKELGLSQEYVAEGIPLSLNAYIKIEKGTTRLISKRLEQIASVLDTTVEELLLGPNMSLDKHEAICNKICKEYEMKLSELSKQLELKDLFIRRMDEMLNEKNGMIEDLRRTIEQQNRTDE